MNKGYFGGGNSGTNSAVIDGIDFTTEAAINPSTTLSVARYALAGVSSSSKGYFGGGNSGIYNEIDGIDFTTEAAINPSTTLSVARYALAGVSSSSKGYFGGGIEGNLKNEIDGIDFTTESAVNPSATLSVARSYLAGVSSSSKGYFGGGNSGTNSTKIDGLDFTTESTVNPSATLSIARQTLAGVSSSSKGYFGGGNAGSTSAEIDGIDFSTEAAINPSTILVARYYLAGVSSSSKGYFGGGTTGTYSSEIDGIDFVTEAAINPSATLSVARYALAGVAPLISTPVVTPTPTGTLPTPTPTTTPSTPSVSGKGYFGGGYIGQPGSTSEIDGINFQTEVATNTSTALSVARAYLAGVSSVLKGYFGGGFSWNPVGNINEIDGIDFSTEAAINPSATLSVARQNLTGVSSLSNGYFGGGYSNLIDKLAFNTESSSSSNYHLSASKQSLLGLNSFDKGYFIDSSSSVDVIVFSTDTLFTITGNYVDSSSTNGVSSNSRGYFGASTNNIINGFDFTSETIISISASYSSRQFSSGVNSSTKGYFGGGRTSITQINLSEIDGIDFLTETSINPSASLSLARHGLAGVSPNKRTSAPTPSNTPTTTRTLTPTSTPTTTPTLTKTTTTTQTITRTPTQTPRPGQDYCVIKMSWGSYSNPLEKTFSIVGVAGSTVGNPGPVFTTKIVSYPVNDLYNSMLYFSGSNDYSSGPVYCVVNFKKILEAYPDLTEVLISVVLNNNAGTSAEATNNFWTGNALVVNTDTLTQTGSMISPYKTLTDELNKVGLVANPIRNFSAPGSTKYLKYTVATNVYEWVEILPTPTPTPSNTKTQTPTRTMTPTISNTKTSTPNPTPTNTPSTTPAVVQNVAVLTLNLKTQFHEYQSWTKGYPTWTVITSYVNSKLLFANPIIDNTDIGELGPWSTSGAVLFRGSYPVNTTIFNNRNGGFYSAIGHALPWGNIANGRQSLKDISNSYLVCLCRNFNSNQEQYFINFDKMMIDFPGQEIYIIELVINQATTANLLVKYTNQLDVTGPYNNSSLITQGNIIVNITKTFGAANCPWGVNNSSKKYITYTPATNTYDIIELPDYTCITPTPTQTATQTNTPTNTRSNTPTPSITATKTQTPTQTKTQTQTPTVTRTNTPSKSLSQTPTKTLTPTRTSTPSRSGSRTPTPTMTKTSAVINERGYFGGGLNNFAGIDYLQYNTETLGPIAEMLSLEQNRNIATCSSQTTAYLVGGFWDESLDIGQSINEFSYATETITPSSDYLPHTGALLAGVSSPTQGYVAGGIHNTKITSINYTTNTVTETTQGLVTQNVDDALVTTEAFYSYDNAYFFTFGGTLLEKFDFSQETLSSENYIIDEDNLVTTQCSARGYITGYKNNNVLGYDYSTQIFNYLTTKLNVSRESGAAVSSILKAYIRGDSNTSVNANKKVEMIVHDTLVNSVLSSSLTTQAVGGSNWSKDHLSHVDQIPVTPEPPLKPREGGYFLDGLTAVDGVPAAYTGIDVYDFNNKTIAEISAKLMVPSIAIADMNTSTYGYYNSNIVTTNTGVLSRAMRDLVILYANTDKMNYAIDVITPIQTMLPEIRSGMVTDTGLNSLNQGYTVYSALLKYSEVKQSWFYSRQHIDALVFSTETYYETMVATKNNIKNMSSFNTPQKGFIINGFFDGSNMENAIDGISFSTETYYNASLAGMVTTTINNTNVANFVKSYMTLGFNPNLYYTTNQFLIPTESILTDYIAIANGKLEGLAGTFGSSLGAIGGNSGFVNVISFTNGTIDITNVTLTDEKIESVGAQPEFMAPIDRDITPTPTISFTPTNTPSVTSSGTPNPTPTTTNTQTPTNSQTPTTTQSITATQTNTGTVTKTSTRILVTPSNSPTISVTNTQTPTRTFLTATPTNTGTQTQTATVTKTETSTPTQTPTNTETPTQTPSNTITSTGTQTPSKSAAATPTGTATVSVSPTISNTATITKTPTNTITPTKTQTPTNTSTRTLTATGTGTPTSSLTATQTRTAAVTPTRTGTPTLSLTSSETPTATKTPTSSMTATSTKSLTPTATETPTATTTVSETATATLTPTPTSTLTITATSTRTITPTASTTKTISSTPTSSATPTQTKTPTASTTQTLSATSTQTPTKTGTPTISDTATVTQTPTNTMSPTGSNTASMTPTGTGTATPTISLTSTLTPTPTNTETPTVSLTSSITATPTETPSGTGTPTLSLTSSKTPTNTGTVTPTSSITATNTETPTPSVTSTQTGTPASTVTPTNTGTPTVSLSPTGTVTPTLSISSTKTLTPTPTQTRTPAPTTTSTVSLSVTPTISNTNTGTPTSTKTLTPTTTITTTSTNTPIIPTPTPTSTPAPTNAIVVPDGVTDLHTSDLYHTAGIFFIRIKAASASVIGSDLNATAKTNGIWGTVLTNVSNKIKITKYSGGSFLNTMVIHAGLSAPDELHSYKVTCLWQDQSSTQQNKCFINGSWTNCAKAGPSGPSNLPYATTNALIAAKEGISPYISSYGAPGYVSTTQNGLTSLSSTYDNTTSSLASTRACPIIIVAKLERLD